ncbi:MAG TPA: hypothetical protein VFX98_07995 [Longimicrobiaceae bacterium]|nr:hypothetical protein [Longimicrobiaceae bacterium]
MLRLLRRRAPEPAPRAAPAPAAIESDLELTDDALEHVVGGLERIYIYAPDGDGSEGAP